jgi:hypothetical protein
MSIQLMEEVYQKDILGPHDRKLWVPSHRFR